MYLCIKPRPASLVRAMVLRITAPALVVTCDTDLDLPYHARSKPLANCRDEVRSSRSILDVALWVLSVIGSLRPVLGEVKDDGDQVRDKNLSQIERHVVHVVSILRAIILLRSNRGCGRLKEPFWKPVAP